LVLVAQQMALETRRALGQSQQQLLQTVALIPT
jgi:hypothetical protein